jgi:predicted DNA-binding transcriptional regulator AlpA
VNVNVSFDGNNITTINNGTSGEQILTQATISSIAENTYKPVKIVVSKLVGAKTYAKTYTIYLTYSASATFPKSQLASGGYVSFIEGEKDEWFELHTFSEAGTESNLIFSNISSLAGGTVTADVLIVAGGGGAGVNGNVDDGSGGGGAGGLLYFTNRADELTSRSGSAIQIAEGTISVFVGTGGAGGAFSNFGSDGKQNGLEGQNGGDSAFGLYTAIGGGASRGLYPGNSVPGKNGNDGGSGGGGDGSRVEQGGLGGLAIRATSGSASGILQGYDGGKSAFNDGGGGGGGAGGAGGDGNDSDLIKTNDKIVTGGAGGQGKTISITGETKTYSRGGNGGGNNTPLVEASYYGDGAPGTNNSQKTTGYSGYQGIVIVLFPNDTGVTP